ncbi:Transcription factor [Wickerhamomyces ciferrii]|uniref:Transcription factor BYE1 n=1 Tax=Wickerhamomyces ciferrii (strain ATCC 14091 / BCRC 22168 / CBS 111 / JCM 3599 / NBRC 0793 / NRRL Y-1031 F-60-10) TaxID=1206466 RepID=K0KLY4_WICCF|nr:Transcription factor [Wickerhamomyces ciferrii]CCH44011.1 Transcription factor [Wickerhamomyces ciferrii]
MSDIRRSSRSNKGKNSRLEEQIKYEELISKRKEQEGNANDDDEEEEGEVLCTVCGTTDDNYDAEEDDRDMIQCEECLSWQHTVCIFGKKKVPNLYKCNICDPNNIIFAKLKFELDPETIMLKKRKSKSNSNKKKQIGDDYKSNDNDKDQDEDQDNNISDNDNIQEENLSDDEYKVKTNRPSSSRKRSRSDDSIKSETKKRPTQRSRQSSSITINENEIELKARDAVKKRFETMFNKLLTPGTKIPNETDSLDELSHKWAKKLEDELFNVYHNLENGKLTPLYKEVSTRIFVNVKDEKNLKLRNSIINKQILFKNLVKMPVSELLNPDLQREKEEAIKESMTQATLEAPQMSNIRRTHKGDVLIEKEFDNSNQQYDFNVGLKMDNDDKKFIKSETSVLNDRKNSNIFNNERQYDDEEDDDVHVDDEDHNERQERSRSNSIHEDEALLQILGETEKDVQKQQEKRNKLNDEYSPISQNLNFKWSGQTIFVGMTNFASELKFKSTSLDDEDFNKISQDLLDNNLPLEIEGRLDLKKADDYIKKVSKSRKLILLQLFNTDGELNDKNFYKLFDYFHSRSKCGVIKNKESFIKDGYLIPCKTSRDQPRFFKEFNQEIIIDDEDKPKLFIVFIIKQELIKDFKPINSSQLEIQPLPPTIPQPNVPSNEFLSRLPSNVLELVNKIFDEKPETRVDSNLLINYLKSKISNGENI